MIWTGPLADPVEGPLAALTDDDRAWLDRMADVLPPGWIINGTTAWAIRWHHSWITTETVRW